MIFGIGLSRDLAVHHLYVTIEEGGTRGVHSSLSFGKLKFLGRIAGVKEAKLFAVRGNEGHIV